MSPTPAADVFGRDDYDLLLQANQLFSSATREHVIECRMVWPAPDPAPRYIIVANPAPATVGIAISPSRSGRSATSGGLVGLISVTVTETLIWAGAWRGVCGSFFGMIGFLHGVLPHRARCRRAKS
jgi:hypothetical protein